MGLTDVTITRSRTIKLAGAALGRSALTMLWPAEADARRKKKPRRRRKARVTTDPSTLPKEAGTPMLATLNITNPSGSNPLTISDVKLFRAEGAVVDPAVPVTIAPGDTATIPITVTYAPSGPLVDAGKLRVYDGGGVPLQVTNGNTSGNIDLAFAPIV